MVYNKQCEKIDTFVAYEIKLHMFRVEIKATQTRFILQFQYVLFRGQMVSIFITV